MTAPTSKLDVQGDVSAASIGNELSPDSTGAACSANGACVTKSVSVTSGVDYVVKWDQQHSVGDNGSITPYIGTVAGIAQSYTTGTLASGIQQIITANTTGAVNLVFTVSGFTSGTITLSNVSLKALTPSNPVQRILNSDGTEGLSIYSGGSSYFNTFLGFGVGKHSYNLGIGGAGSPIGTAYGSMANPQYNNILGGFNSGFGYQVLSNNTRGSNNTAMGNQALYSNTTGWSNAAFGAVALLANTTGFYNTAVGEEALLTNTTGTNNTAVGMASLGSSITGKSNTALGSEALILSTTASYNTAVGTDSMYTNTTGGNNTCLGFSCLKRNTTGARNISVGYQAGDHLTTGSQNIIIGYDIDAPAVDSANILDIGNLIYGTGLSASGTTLSTGSIGIGVTNPGAKLEINGGVRLNTATAKPTCDSTQRGTFWVTQGAAGVKDTVEVCAKDAADAYAWRTLY